MQAGLRQIKQIQNSFGLRNASSTFRRLIDRFRADVAVDSIFAYLDDNKIFETIKSNSSFYKPDDWTDVSFGIWRQSQNHTVN